MVSLDARHTLVGYSGGRWTGFENMEPGSQILMLMEPEGCIGSEGKLIRWY